MNLSKTLIALLLGSSILVPAQAQDSVARTSATIAKGVAAATSIAVGTSVMVVAETTGYALMTGGRLIACVPNEAARGLLYRSRH